MIPLKKVTIRAAVILLAAAILADRFIRSIGALLGAMGEEAFAAIFSQLQDANIIPGIFLAAIPALLSAWLICRVRAAAGKIALAAVGLLAAWIAAIWSASVNSIVFGDVISSLIGLLGSGALAL